MMTKPPTPPPAPLHPSERDFSRGIKWSFILHVLALMAIFIKSAVFPGEPMIYVPSLRVDLVGLPDILKKDLAKIEPLKEAEQDADVKPATSKTKDTPDPDEMVLKPKTAKKNEKDTLDKKLKNSLARIKALAKISGESELKTAPVIRGNIISHGTSLSGDAKESSESGYFDLVRGRLQENWALPVWLSRQKLSAQVQIFIDSRGRLRDLKFTKGSGNPQFDEAVKKTLAESQPYPFPPREIASSLLLNGILVGFPL